MKSVIKATSHSAVSLCVNKLSMHFLAEKNARTEEQIDGETRKTLAREVFYTCNWKTAFER